MLRSPLKNKNKQTTKNPNKLFLPTPNSKANKDNQLLYFSFSQLMCFPVVGLPLQKWVSKLNKAW